MQTLFQYIFNSTMIHHVAKLTMHVVRQMWLFPATDSHACQRSCDVFPCPSWPLVCWVLSDIKLCFYPFGASVVAKGSGLWHHWRTPQAYPQQRQLVEVALSWRPRRWHTTCLRRLPKRKDDGLVVMAMWQGGWQDNGDSGAAAGGTVGAAHPLDMSRPFWPRAFQ